MTVAVPFHLRRLPDAKPAAGLLLESSSVETLLTACAPLRHVIIFAVDGGFLLLADDLPESVLQGVKLRRLSENGYLPADAELLPSLLPDEAADLTRRQGLVFLPGGRILSFDPATGKKPTDFLRLPPIRRHRWQAFPDVEQPAPELRSIQRILPPPPPGELIAQDGPPIGDEDPRPADTSLKNKMIGKSSHALGTGLGALGKLFNSKKLKDLAQRLKDKGIEKAPRLTESILGQQEAALQELLKRFKSGNIDDALRRAVPFGGEPSRGSRSHTGTQLPTNNLGFSLGNLSNGGGSGGIWQGGRPETWNNLLVEYRRAAQEAAQRGDYRRTAVIYAKLLGDVRSAAEVLSQGGLHRESAVLFRDKVKDFKRAAREFEKAGDHDEALSLYRKFAEFELAGDLLRQMGEEEQAVDEYHRAAERITKIEKDYLRAGELMLRKTGRASLAGAYFALGWQQRKQLPAAGVMSCGYRLLEIYAFARPREAFWNHIAEAEEWLFDEGWNNRTTEVATFFNKLADLGDLPHLKDERPAIRDKARVMLGLQLRSHAEYERTPGNVVSALFGQNNQWKPEMVSDAAFALKSFLKADTRPTKPKKRELRNVRLGESPVMAIAHAPQTGLMFISFQDGSLMKYDPRDSSTHKILRPGETDNCIHSLATDLPGNSLAGIFPNLDSSGHVLYLWDIDATSRERSRAFIGRPGWTTLIPLIDVWLDGTAVGVKNQSSLDWHEFGSSIPRIEAGASEPFEPSALHLRLRVLISSIHSTCDFDRKTLEWASGSANLGWEPLPITNGAGEFINLSWQIITTQEILLAGIDKQGVLHRTSVLLHAATKKIYPQTSSHTVPGGYRGVSLTKGGRVAAVTFSNKVVWLRFDTAAQKLQEAAPPVQLSSIYRPAGCYFSPSTDELIVVMGSGEAFHVPVPV
ncbi:hypothetical protein [Zavarzinella formosa]|uniref:hypothetical protein n=1 Tax=Zavarzinella formosa TaxID=360055 RepID=UPI00031F9C9E|nr:hypothetical protein [Zavarzinella formosa]